LFPRRRARRGEEEGKRRKKKGEKDEMININLSLKKKNLRRFVNR
jgi:hypothetical protein